MANDPAEEDMSFVVLGPGSMPSYMTSRQPSVISNGSNVLSMDTVGIQQRLDQLFLENKNLRETLDANNATMKTQFDTLARWQQDVLNAHENHKTKFAETRELVMKLKAENLALKSGNDQKVVLREIDNQLNAVVNALTLDKEQLMADRAILVKERDAFREECTRLNNKVVILENVIRQKTEEAQILKGNYKSLAYSSPSMPASEDSHSKDWSLVAEAKSRQELEHQLQSASVQIVQISQLLEAEKFKSEELRKIRQHERENYEKEKESDCERIAKLKEELIEARREFSLQTEDLEKKQILLDASLAELRSKRQNDVNDEIAVLKAENELYEKDYKDERAARERVAEEKENIAEELRVMKARLVRLEGEQSTEDPRQVSAEAPPSSEPVAVIDQTERPPEQVHIFKCPLCRQMFSSEQECQRHANYCLDTRG